MRVPKFSDQEAEDFFKYDYIDRGMIKWQGFYLSDHTSALNAEHEAQNKALHREIPPQMTSEEITSVINQAIVKNRVVEIQTNKCDGNGIYDPPIIGKIKGYMENDLYIDNDCTVGISVIRHVSIANQNREGFN